ncbi:hypothetical protein IXB28_16125 [Leptothoe kymatousa TAU-MAC 1615]|uniref:Uncharacterized protein n=1 Tax=Leptothoe kymatousa TAU-MAC 1615 TaxID=2364775 RepID=A0ABS5Y8A8_9CYAN|nr:hypothetical protein [Leptothoe kymatousa TAU-MAC 1615]
MSPSSLSQVSNANHLLDLRVMFRLISTTATLVIKAFHAVGDIHGQSNLAAFA